MRRAMTTEPATEACALCGEPIRPGDKAMYRDIPDKGLVRVHIVCVVRVSVGRMGRPRE